MKKYFTLSVCFMAFLVFATAQNTANDPEAALLLQKVSDKYKSYSNISTNFTLLIVRPKIKPEDDERKLTDTLQGKIILQQAKFNIVIKDQHIVCDGKNIWTYIPTDKEVQVNFFEESDDVFSPSKIFSLYKEGYSYQIREKKVLQGKQVTVIEMSPAKKKMSYFKIEVSIDVASLQVIETKVYEKNGVRYIYKLSKQVANAALPNDTFTFDVKNYPGVKLVDLR